MNEEKTAPERSEDQISLPGITPRSELDKETQDKLDGVYTDIRSAILDAIAETEAQKAGDSTDSFSHVSSDNDGNIGKFAGSMIYEASKILISAITNGVIQKAEHNKDDIIEAATAFFFLMHEELKPRGSGNLTIEQQEELLAAYSGIRDFIKEKSGAVELSANDFKGLFRMFADTEVRRAGIWGVVESYKLRGIKTKSHNAVNDPLSNYITDEAMKTGEAVDLPVKNKPPKIYAYCVITGDFGGKPVSEYDRQVLDSIVTLWRGAQENKQPPIVTAEMIYSEMPGGGKKITDAARERIETAIEHLRNLHVYYDMTEDAQAAGIIKEGGSFKLDGFCISATKGTYKMQRGGKEVSAYKISDEPLPARVSNAKNQMLSIPKKYLAISQYDGEGKKPVSMNATRQAIAGYLLRRIATMKRSTSEKCKEVSRTISLDEVMKKAEVDRGDKFEVKRAKDFVYVCLDYWKRTKWIKDYTRRTEAKTVSAVIITLDGEGEP